MVIQGTEGASYSQSNQLRATLITNQFTKESPSLFQSTKGTDIGAWKVSRRIFAFNLGQTSPVALTSVFIVFISRICFQFDRSNTQWLDFQNFYRCWSYQFVHMTHSSIPELDCTSDMKHNSLVSIYIATMDALDHMGSTRSRGILYSPKDSLRLALRVFASLSGKWKANQACRFPRLASNRTSFSDSPSLNRTIWVQSCKENVFVHFQWLARRTITINCKMASWSRVCPLGNWKQKQ